MSMIRKEAQDRQSNFKKVIKNKNLSNQTIMLKSSSMKNQKIKTADINSLHRHLLIEVLEYLHLKCLNFQNYQKRIRK
jgi:hypothetical protein